MAWPATIPTFTALATLTAAKLNDLRDALNVIGGAWATYTPALTASGTTPTLGASTITGSYRQALHTIDIQINLTIGSGWAPGTGFYRFSLPSGVTPVNAALAGESFGGYTVWDASAANVVSDGCVYPSATGTVRLSSAGTPLGQTSPVVWAAGDRVSISIRALELS